ncbi:MAG: hypothetical protein ACFFDK_17040, partial [Promethearchaeota archaeon]
SQTISKLEIPINKIFYNKDSKILSIEVLGFTYIGHYKKSTTIGDILDDIFKSLREIQVERDKIYILDEAHLHIPENTKLKNLKIKAKVFIEEKEKKKKKISKEREITTKDYAVTLEEEAEEEVAEEYFDDQEEKPKADKLELRRDITDELSGLEMREKKVAKKERARLAPAKPRAPAPPGTGPSTGAARETTSAPPPRLEGIKTEAEEEPQPIRYDINMGFQYYSVMMEQQSYFFYVYLSFKELIIQDEEGKTIYKTRFTIITTKEEPPILDLRIVGEGFEVHPLSGKVEVKKDFVNPPVMIFSVLPIKSKKLKKKKESEKRFLNVYVDFEGKTVSHSILSIVVQPKHFHLDVGPFHFNLTKTQAMLISFISILITIGSVAYSLLTLDVSGATTDIISSFAPGIGSLIFLGTFLYTLIKEGIYPVQQQINSLLNFDKGITMLK